MHRIKRIGLRDLNEHESALIARLLSAEFPGKAILAKQLVGCQVMTIDEYGSLKIKPSVTEQAAVPARIPVEGIDFDQDGYMIHYLLHVVDGVINELEIYKDNSAQIIRRTDPKDLELLIYGK
jgi:hypothetical protein